VAGSGRLGAELACQQVPTGSFSLDLSATCVTGHHLHYLCSALFWGDEKGTPLRVSAFGVPSLGLVFQLIKCEEEASTPKPRIELPERFRIRPVTPVEKYIQVLPSPPVPKTTQGFIGWRSGVPGLNKCLEHDCEIRSCKGAYAKELNWPKQGIH
uniref:Ciliary microtubule inner protein 1 n=1 Tax=Sus scrofa TaxID=9823 RepID=A0A8D1B1F8_PIG